MKYSYGDKLTNPEIKPNMYNAIYRMHKYWAKKPYNVINEYIQKYSKKNDIILDPFSGSGIALIEALNTKRKAIGIDINPTASIITKTILTSVNLEKFKVEFEKIEKDCKDKINSFYEVKRGNKTNIGSHFIWNNGKLEEVRFKNGKFVYLKPISSDVKLAKSFSYSKIKKFYPKDKLFENARINADAKLRVCDLFTPRNTTALAILLDRINHIKDASIRDAFRICFTSMLGQTSKMVFVVNNSIINNEKKKLKTRKIGSWIIGYWVPKEHFEINVWNCFVARFQKMLKSKRIQQENFNQPEFVKNFTSLKKGDIFFLNKPAIDGLKKIPTNSVEYILTDPPHGDRIPYLELSQMWNSWLNNKVNYKKEIIVSGAKERNKDITNYLELFEKTMKEMVRVLKPNKYLTLMFNTHNERTWQEIFNFAKEQGLKIHDITTLTYSRNSIVQEHKEGGLRFDFVLTFKKTKSS